MYHYILLFINKVLYYIRNPFLHIENPFCDFVIVILWLMWLIELYPIRQRSKKQIILSYRSSTFICLSLCNTSYYRVICNTCYPSTSKTNVFLKILLTFAAQKRKRSTILYLQPLTLSLYLMHETATMEESRKFKC